MGNDHERSRFSSRRPAVPSICAGRSDLRRPAGAVRFTVHDIERVDGGPVIGAGRAANAPRDGTGPRALLKRAAHGGFLPKPLLYMEAT